MDSASLLVTSQKKFFLVLGPEVIGVTSFDSCSCSLECDSSSCSGAHWKFTLRPLFALRKRESRVCFATWGKI